MPAMIDRDRLAGQICAIIERLGSGTASSVELELGTLGSNLVRQTLAQLVIAGRLTVALEMVRYDARWHGPKLGLASRQYRAKVYRLTKGGTGGPSA